MLAPRGTKAHASGEASAMSSYNAETLLLPIIELACNAYRFDRMRCRARARAQADRQAGNAHARSLGAKSRWQGARARHGERPRADRGGGHALLYCSHVSGGTSVA